MSVIVMWRMLNGADRRAIFGTAREWASRVIDFAGVELRYELPEQGLDAPAYLLMCTHSSHFDVPALFARSPLPICPIAKQELGMIPLFGWALKRGVAILIDRRSKEAAQRSIQAAVAEIQGGATVLMFPEGTRTPSGELGPLKRGAFHLAQEAGVPILPVAIQGSAEVLPVGSWQIQPHPISVRFGAPIDPQRFPAGKAGREAMVVEVERALRALLQPEENAAKTSHAA